MKLQVELSIVETTRKGSFLWITCHELKMARPVQISDRDAKGIIEMLGLKPGDHDDGTKPVEYK